METNLVVGPKEVNKNFNLAMRNLKNYKLVNPNKVNVLDMLKLDKVIFTEKSLKEFTELFLSAYFMQVKPKCIRDKKIEEILNLFYNKE